MIIFRCWDFETTGIPKQVMDDKNPERHGVIETGYCDLMYPNGQQPTEIPKTGGMILEPVAMLSNPKRDCDLEARAVHHIAPAEYADAPSPDRVFMKLMSAPGRPDDKPDFFVAHNADYEQAFFFWRGCPDHLHVQDIAARLA